MHVNQKLLYFCLIFVLLMVSPNLFADQGKVEALSEVCEVFDEIKSSGLNRQQQGDYIIQNIDNRVSNREVDEAFNVILTLDQSIRYQTFKEMAEVLAERKWSCPSMQEMLNPTTN